MKRNIVIAALFYLLGTGACKKNSGTNAGSAGGPVNVYVAGYVSNGSHTAAVYWKNGNQTDLTDGARQASANSIFVSGTDVYVAGYESNGTIDIAQYWKNGSPVTLAGGPYSSFATSIVVSGTDVYVAGYELNAAGNYVAEYWKNGTPVILTDGTSDVYVKAMAVSGTDVYVGGYGQSTNGTTIAEYWINGSVVQLTNGQVYARCNGLCVSGTNIYVCGWIENSSLIGNTAQYWMNNNVTPLAGNSANAITASGNDVYAAGSTGDGAPVYWKDGNPVALSDGLNNAYGSASGVAIWGTDVYVSGGGSMSFDAATIVAEYWKNGSPVVLNNASGGASANGIFLSPQ
jgi:hypothetical protein